MSTLSWKVTLVAWHRLFCIKALKKLFHQRLHRRVLSRFSFAGVESNGRYTSFEDSIVARQMGHFSQYGAHTSHITWKFLWELNEKDKLTIWLQGSVRTLIWFERQIWHVSEFSNFSGLRQLSIKTKTKIVWDLPYRMHQRFHFLG